jgi:DNA-directed RNA polymerase specialized sigma24 family protein
MRNETVHLAASEAALVRLVREGHISAFAALFDLHKANIYSLCLRATADADDAEQLVQAIFLDVFRMVTACSDATAFSELLYRTTDSRIQMREHSAHLSAPSLDHLVELAAERDSLPPGVSRFSRMRAIMRNARGSLSDQQA